MLVDSDIPDFEFSRSGLAGLFCSRKFASLDCGPLSGHHLDQLFSYFPAYPALGYVDAAGQARIVPIENIVNVRRLSHISISVG